MNVVLQGDGMVDPGLGSSNEHAMCIRLLPY